MWGDWAQLSSPSAGFAGLSCNCDQLASRMLRQQALSLSLFHFKKTFLHGLSKWPFHMISPQALTYFLHGGSDLLKVQSANGRPDMAQPLSPLSYRFSLLSACKRSYKSGWLGGGWWSPLALQETPIWRSQENSPWPDSECVPGQKTATLVRCCPHRGSSGLVQGLE
jgi:hypothetical protein